MFELGSLPPLRIDCLLCCSAFSFLKLATAQRVSLLSCLFKVSQAEADAEAEVI